MTTPILPVVAMYPPGGKLLHRVAAQAIDCLQAIEQFGVDVGSLRPMLPDDRLCAVAAQHGYVAALRLAYSMHAQGQDLPVERVAENFARNRAGTQYYGGLMASWAQEGLPRVEFGAKHAALLAATSTGPSAARELLAVMPWTTFMVTVPDGMLAVPTALPVEGEATKVLLGQMDVDDAKPVVSSLPVHHFLFSLSTGPDGAQPHMNFVFLPASGDMPHVVVRSGVEELVHVDDITVFDAPVQSPALVIASRLVLGAIAELMQYRQSASAAAGAAVPARKHASSTAIGDVVPTTFRVVRDVYVDFRDAVAQVGGNGVGRAGSASPATVRSIVAAHRKMQPYGPESRLRKPIVVGNYARGNPALPIALRAHHLPERVQSDDVTVRCNGKVLAADRPAGPLGAPAR